MSTRYARRCQAAYLGWCHIHGLKAASTKNFFWYVAQQSPQAQRALLADVHWGPPEHHDHPDSPAPFNEVGQQDGPDPKKNEKRHAPHYQGSRKQAARFKHRAVSSDGKEALRGSNHPYTHAVEIFRPEDHPDVKNGYHPPGWSVESFHTSEAQAHSVASRWAKDKPKSRDGMPAQPGIPSGVVPVETVDAQKQASRKQAWSGWGPSVFPKARQVTGWKWDNHLDGYTSNSPQKFACECGTEIPTPSGFQRCACGKQWNSYVIGTSGSSREASAEKFLVREITIRTEGNVIVAGRKLSGPVAYDDMWTVRHPQEGVHGYGHTPEDAEKARQSLVNSFGGDPGYTIHAPKSGYRTACWPGCHENEAHAKKFHKKKESGRHDDPFAPDNYDEFSHIHDPAELNTTGGKPGIARDLGPGMAHHPKHQATVRLIDPRTGRVHKLVDPGEIHDKDGHDDDPHGKHKVKKPPRDWAHRGDGAKWRKRTFGKG